MLIIPILQVRNSIFTIFNPERPKKSSLVDTLIDRCRPVWKAVLSLPPQLVEMACGMLCSCVFCQWQSLGVGAELSFLCDSGLGIPSLLSLWVPGGSWWGSGMRVFYPQRVFFPQRQLREEHEGWGWWCGGLGWVPPDPAVRSRLGMCLRSRLGMSKDKDLRISYSSAVWESSYLFPLWEDPPWTKPYSWPQGRGSLTRNP